MASIRKRYRVPARRGGRVEYWSLRDGERMQGVIVLSKGNRLLVRLDGSEQSYVFHPTDFRYL